MSEQQQQKDECMSEGQASMRGQLDWFVGRLKLNGYGALPCGRCGRYGDLRVQDIHDGLEYLLASQAVMTQRAEAGESELSRLEAENVRLREEIQKVADDLTAENESAHMRLNTAEHKLSALIASVRETVNDMRRNVVNSAAIGSGALRPKSIASGRDVQRWADALQQAIGDTQ